MYVFSIFDEVAEDWSSPFCAKNVEHLKRVLQVVFKQGLVLDECYVSCIGKLCPNGVVDNSENVVNIFGDFSCFYLSELFKDELDKLKDKEVKEDV